MNEQRMNTGPVRILGLAGSLRRASHNRGLIAAAAELAPSVEAIVESADLRGIPFYDGDVEAAGFPPEVSRLKEAVRSADALLIATPEYNHSYSGMLKNALEWVSRPMKETPFRGKPVAVLGAGGVHGTSRAQYHLRQVLHAVDAHTLNLPEVMVARSWEKFDAEGRLTDEVTREQVRALLQALVAWSRRLRVGPLEPT